jgi:hypothetical protein
MAARLPSCSLSCLDVNKVLRLMPSCSGVHERRQHTLNHSSQPRCRGVHISLSAPLAEVSFCPVDTYCDVEESIAPHTMVLER